MNTLQEEEESDFTTQIIDMLFQNDAFKTKLLQPLKKKSYPYILTGVAFNLLILVLMCFLVFSIYNIKFSLVDIRRRLD